MRTNIWWLGTLVVNLKVREGRSQYHLKKECGIVKGKKIWRFFLEQDFLCIRLAIFKLGT